MTTRGEASRGFQVVHQHLAWKEPNAGKFDNRAPVVALLELWPGLVNGPKFVPPAADQVPVNELAAPFLIEGLVRGLRAGDKP